MVLQFTRTETFGLVVAGASVFLLAACAGIQGGTDTKAERTKLEQRLSEIQRDDHAMRTRLLEARQIEKSYRAGIDTVLEKKWAAAVIYHAEHRLTGSNTNLGEMCGPDLKVTEEEVQGVPPTLRNDYRCVQDSNIGAQWSREVGVRPGSVDRLICASSPEYTTDDFDGDLEVSGPKSQIRLNCMNGAQYLSRILDEIESLETQVDLNGRHADLIKRRLADLDDVRQ